MNNVTPKFTSHQLKLDWTGQPDLPTHWYNNSPLYTHFMNALGSSFIDGERFFIDSVNAYKDQISTNPQLQADVQEFIKQENWHRYQHTLYNRWLDSRGFPAKSIEDDMREFFARQRSRWGDRACLAATIAMEHITARNAELMLKYRKSFKLMHPHFESVWRWHSIEEIEHKSISIDVWRHIEGDNTTRRLAMIVVLYYYTYFMMRNTLKLLKADQSHISITKLIKDAYVILWDRRSGLLRNSFSSIWSYMIKSDWHPNDTDHSTLLKYSKT
jgi:predicted metal-dependent hydrolase